MLNSDSICNSKLSILAAKINKSTFIKKATAANMASAIAALTKFNATSDGTVVTVTQATAGEAGNTKVTSANKTCVNTKSFKGGGYAYDEHDEATAALTAGYAKNTADAKLLEHARKRNLGLI